MFPRLSALLVVSLLLSGCVSTTRIYSEPPGARVVVDHKRQLGQTPIELEETVWLWTRHQLTVSKEGYTSQNVQIRSEGLKFGYVAVCVCTAGLLLPLLLASSYPQQYTVTLQQAAPTVSRAEFQSRPEIDFAESPRP